ncbi:ABC transporter substrate-binding protein [uncultured Eubacterium sp.]|uniref:ABC transporter substrate-binding protein n=1 Tax=uncultured Eubacterium sp. TaxID=165185 RepID=UPI00259A45B7|nr:ABC transporter substrate-binding protein [uncultured Eubacterium sp.]
MKNCRKIISAALAVALAVVFTAGCGKTSSAPAKKSGKGAAKKVTFCLDWTPNTNHTGIYVAKKLGYYKDAGIDVKVVQPPEDGAATMCASGKAQFAVEAQDTMAAALDSDAPLGISAVAAIIQHNTSGIMSRKGDGIDRPKGLSGKTYSTWESPIELAMIRNVVNGDGGNYKSIKKIPNNITDEPAALKAKQTDAIWVFQGWGGINAKVENVPVDFWRFADINKVMDYYTPVIIANNDFLKKDPETAKAFLKATQKGYEYAIKHSDEAAKILIAGDDTGSLKGSEKLVTESQEWMAKQYAKDADYWGQIDPKRWNAFYKWLYQNKLSKTDLTGKGYNTKYLSK